MINIICLIIINGRQRHKILRVKEFSLEQNYPNPFNPSTTIKYTIAKPDLVKIAVYNTLGQKVKELVNEVKGTGSYSISFQCFFNLKRNIFL